MGVTNTNAYDGPFYPNGVTTSFPFTFRTMSTSEVIIVDDRGSEIVGFSFAIVPAVGADGGTIVFDAPPTAGELPAFLIASAPAFGVGIDLGSVTAFNPRTLNPSFERLAVQNIFLQNSVDRAFTVPFGEAGVLLPPAAERAGGTMGFGGNGELVVYPQAPVIGDGYIDFPFELDEGDTVISVVDAAGVPFDLRLNGNTLERDVDYVLIGDTAVLTIPADPRDADGVGDAGSIRIQKPALLLQAQAVNVLFRNLGLSPVIRTMAARGQLEVYASDYAGFDASGGTSSRDAILRAADSFGSRGGSVLISAREIAYIGEDFEIPPDITLVGPHRFPGVKKNNISPTTFNAAGGRLLLNPAKERLIGDGGGLQGLIITPKGMSFPQTTTAGYSGLAWRSNGDDMGIANCLIIGFAKILESDHFARHRFMDICWDALSGFDIADCLDVPYFTRLHGWPFGTIQQGGHWQNLIRPGIAYHFHDTVDWPKLTDCFAYGYRTGLHAEDINSLVATSCGFDNAFDPDLGGPLHAGSKGVVLVGNCKGVRFTGLQASAMGDAGVEINLTAGRMAHVDGSIWATNGANTAAVRVLSGDAMLYGEWRDHTNGLECRNNASRIGGEVWMDNISQIIRTVQTSNINLIPRFAATVPAGQQVVVPIGGGTLEAATIASAANLVLPMNDPVLRVTGSVNIGNILGGYKGRRISLVFVDGGLTVFNGTANINSVRLAGGANFAAGAGSALHLVHFGNQWYEEGRA